MWKPLLIVPVVVFGTALVGCGPPGSSVPAESQGEPMAAPGAAGDRTAFGVAAIETAERHAAGAAFDLDYESQTDTWEVEVWPGQQTEMEVHVDGSGRQVMSADPEEVVETEDRQRMERAAITLVEAIEIASAEVPPEAALGLADAGLDGSASRGVWEIEFEQPDGTDVDVTVHAETGEIIAVDVD